MRRFAMHQTPNIPGTNNPNPGGSQGSDPEGPSTDPTPGPEPDPDPDPNPNPIPGTTVATPATLDYGGVHPTGGTAANRDKINPKAPTSGTENRSRGNGR